MPDFTYAPHLQLGDDTTNYRKLSGDFVTTFEADGKTFLKVAPEGLRLLAGSDEGCIVLPPVLPISTK